MKPVRPYLLTVGAYGSLVGAGVLALVLLAAASGVGRFSIDNVDVAAPEFLAQLGLITLAFIVLLVGIAVAVLTDKVWSRDLMVVFWFGVGAWSFGQTIVEYRAGDGFTLDLTWCLFLAFAIWCLYFSRDVASYFQELQVKREINQRAASTDERLPD